MAGFAEPAARSGGLKVLDLGCGFGWFCRWVREHGAAAVLGIDVSENMLARAARETQDAAIVYRRGGLEHVDVAQSAFDLAYSSLALHYIEDLGSLLAKVHAALVPGGHFVFSVEHPIVTAPSRAAWTEVAGRRVWPVDDYLLEGPRRTDWLTEGVVKQHRSMATYLNLLIRSGFAIDHIEEWAPSEAQIAEKPAWADERRRPPFLLVAASR